MKAIGYIRVSTQEQTDSGLSLDVQKRKIEEFAKFKQLDLIEVISDENVSAGIPLNERQGGQKLIEKAKEETVAIIALKLDRLFRDAADCLNMTKVWKDEETPIHLLDLGIDTTTAMGRAFLSSAATYAELERNLISERTKDALQQIKLEGGILGADAYGWKRGPEVDSFGRKKLVPVKEEIEIIGQCQALRALGFTFKQIADTFNAQGKPTKRGGKWFPSTVRNYCKKRGKL
jgi:DNA invertase Pin-like site-specific DNA recombinase